MHRQRQRGPLFADRHESPRRADGEGRGPDRRRARVLVGLLAMGALVHGGCGIVGVESLGRDTPDEAGPSTDSASGGEVGPDTGPRGDSASETATRESTASDSEAETLSDTETPVIIDSNTGASTDPSTDISGDTETENRDSSDSAPDSVAAPDTGSESSAAGTDSETDTETPSRFETDSDTSTGGGTEVDSQQETDTPSAAHPTDSSSGSDAPPGTDTSCTPSPEVCDGLDNDCNLAVDDTIAMAPLCPADQVCIDGECAPLPPESSCLGYQFSTHAYALCGESVDWDTARVRCEQMGAHLATIGSAEEDAAVKTLAPGKQTDAWIGLRRSAACEWEWVTLEPVTYTAWPVNYPDGACGVYDCCQIWSKEEAQWDDTYCVDKQPFICEWEPS
jgi:hypothetical protein